MAFFALRNADLQPQKRQSVVENGLRNRAYSVEPKIRVYKDVDDEVSWVLAWFKVSI
jgi:hypothetical protein